MNGSTGSTTAGYWSPSATSRLLKPKINIMLRGQHRYGSVTHNPTPPADPARFNIDWFAYWLLDETIPDPAKMAQYQRWQAMRRPPLSGKAAGP